MSRTDKDQALILRLYPFAEWDGIVVCLTPLHGVIRLMARGVRRVKSQLSGVLSPFNRVTISFRAGEGDHLGRLHDAYLERGWNIGPNQLEAFYFLSYMAEVTMAIEMDASSSRKIFRLLNALLETVAVSGFRVECLLYFQFWILRIEGQLSDPRYCGRCGGTFFEGREPATILRDHFLFCCGSCVENHALRPDPMAGVLFNVFAPFTNTPPDLLLYHRDVFSVYIESITDYNLRIMSMLGKKVNSFQYLQSILTSILPRD